MTTSIRTTSPNDGDTSTLDRRRGKAQAAKEAADNARRVVAELDVQITANATRTQQDQAALQRASDEVTRLKRALKTAAKESATLRARRKKASAATAKAHVKAQAAETKYDQVVLAEIVRREKDRDRASAATVQVGTPASGAIGTTRVAERPTAAPGTATRTATRKSASAQPETPGRDRANNGMSTNS